MIFEILLLGGNIVGNLQHAKNKMDEIELVEEIELQPLENALFNDAILGIKGLICIISNGIR